MSPHVYVTSDFDADTQTLAQWRASRQTARTGRLRARLAAILSVIGYAHHTRGKVI